MSFRNRFSFLSLMTILVFVASTVMTVPVYADDSTPPVDVPESTEPVEPAAQDEGTEEASLTQPEPESTESILSEVPEGTDLVILNPEGESVPLASREAAEVLVNGDPIWCPAGVAKPVAGVGGCTTPGPANVNYDPTSLGSLLTYLTANQPNKDGTIWIASNYNFANDNAAINFDGITLTVMSNFKLTIKGAWCDGTDVTCVGIIDVSKPSIFDVPLLITNWNNDITLSNITISSTTSGANAFEVSTTKNITLTNVISNNNTGRGAYLQNTGGTGNVTVTNSQFNNNMGNGGLRVESNGMITLKDITANFNANGYGAYLDNDGAITAKAVTISGTNTFNNNGTSSGASGLYVTSFGTIMVNNLSASNNGQGSFGQGAELYNNVPNATAGVTLTGMNIFSDNRSNGLTVGSFGAIKASNLYANSNGNMGVSLQNLAVASTPAVTLTGTNEFKYNDVYGLSVQSKGQITLNNVTANNNGQFGVSLNNQSSTMGVTISGTNTFKTNGYGGLIINSNGAVTLNNLTAEGNGTANTGGGVSVINDSGVSLKGVTITGTNNSFNDNYDTGLSIISSGVVTLNNVTASNSEIGYGVNINNVNSGTAKPQAVTLNGTNIFNNNYYIGLFVDTYGAITTNNLTANDNGQGASVTLGSGVSLINSNGLTPQKITLKGLNYFNNNDESGLLISSDGAILTNTITASGNDDYGVSLINDGGTAGSTVTMTGSNLITANNLHNLLIQSASTILLNNVTASSSTTGMGANISNTAGVAKAVTLTGTNAFNSNATTGLQVSSYGLITLNNVTASINTGSHGAYLSNAGSSTKAGVVLNGTNAFNGNSVGIGLYILSYGNVKTNTITANSNGNYGVYIDLSHNDAIGSVTMNGLNNFTANTSDNLSILAHGAITLNSINSTGSMSGEGIQVNNTYSGTALTKPVTLTGTNIFSGNIGTGLMINSYGVITTNNITASNNMGYGSTLTNPGGDKPAGINILGTNFFDSNAFTGLEVQSGGLIRTNNLTGNNTNNGYGAYLQNPDSAAGVIMTGTNTFNGNSNTGLNVFTKGAITISNLNASSSTGGFGASLNNTISGHAAPKAITLSGSNTFTYNNANGLVIDTYGNVTINNVTASYNGQGMSMGRGVEINGYYGGLSSITNSVTFTGNNTFIGNLHAGLFVITFGAIKANNLTSTSNGDSASVILSNSSALTSASGVTLTGLNTFTDNSWDGLNITSKGAVTLNSINASSNNNEGVNINNTWGTGGVTLTGTNKFNTNNADGLRITTNGVVKANNVTASGNVSGNGAYISNIGAVTPLGVTFTGTNVFNDNTAQDGLYIHSLGAITLNNVTANGNSEGAYLNNNTGTASVTLTGTNTFNNNTNDGLHIQSDGAVSITRITGDDNGWQGLSVGTTGPVTLTCGSFNMNGLYGWVVSASTLTIKGVFTAGNGSGDFINGAGTTVTVRNCPLP